MIGRNGSTSLALRQNDEWAGPIGWVEGQPQGTIHLTQRPRTGNSRAPHPKPSRPLPLRSQRVSSLSEMY
jgi:hypothetical protein